MIVGKITAIGKQAIDPKEKLLIFFDKSATAGLKPYAVIQDVPASSEITLKVGDEISFGTDKYTITHIGNTALKGLHEIQHASFVFDTVPETDSIVNGIYLTPFKVPYLEVGMTITYP
ncbi:PTS sorbitol transporter subunit IIA [Enterococcus saigonensis]|uniref:PTS sorbitol transporter subunit IIA n=1 Tax=Enterococcus saigonensis TaxID=1805431 RepID=A0A679IHX7_9ENTE|nr:PTS glucitol/sorbitol transporter subunit IIA [Enterococcus saigonensis]BCA84885.1 PTS sorbitol transporter subunit IIA [Enterococcus saigonensis]